ncbi:Crp/Fnr family transcriptional regulator [Clostridium grantii]|uniref:cAMP-binding domain of CRP or a regulatory subunit of cAMP-dependent protein kinases n=1 Tax=Clostridium grantii DSM 8605 TaxID=1121316 RepID=A0A1M5T6I7_9CLOT|nr:helix-turn-helix domain-containing protein [Clostridium grantii]SHH46349.1 cAMP-binding domain of CRP or a regulatory subunit of cAMP-dependent protein kinases [Clostridium grantii DSM 8605]
MKIIKDIKILNTYINKFEINKILPAVALKEAALYHFEKSDYICSYGEKILNFYFLVEGNAKVYVLLENGKSFLLKFYEPFSNFGDLEILEKSHYQTNVEALKDTFCIGIPTDIINKYCITDAIFLRYLCLNLSDKLNNLSNISSINILYPLENRLASYLSHIAAGEKIFNLTSSFSDIADLLGTSYRHLSRTLKGLNEKKIIRSSKKRIEILDVGALVELAGELYK